MGRRLVMDRGHLIRLSQIPEFYRRFPEFVNLQTVARESWQMFQEAEKNCQQCGHEWNYMRGVVDAMYERLTANADNTQFRKRFKTMLKERLGYWPDPIVIYYRRAKKGRLKTLKL